MLHINFLGNQNTLSSNPPRDMQDIFEVETRSFSQCPVVLLFYALNTLSGSSQLLRKVEQNKGLLRCLCMCFSSALELAKSPLLGA